MRKCRVLRIVSWLLVVAVVVLLWGQNKSKQQKEQESINAIAQSKLDRIRAIPQDTLEFALFNPIPVEKEQCALVTAPLKDLYEEYGYDRISVAGDDHYAAAHTLRDSIVFLSGEYVDSVPDTGGGNHLRYYDGDTLVGNLFLRKNGQAELYCRLEDTEEICHLLFSVDKACADLLLAAIGRTY